MNFQRGRPHQDMELNLVPLIDVLLVIIIFLVISTTFTRQSELQIKLPTAEANTPEDKPVTINIEIDASGQLRIDQQAVTDTSINGIAAALQRSAGGRQEPTVIINADASTMHKSVINVMEAARQSGYTHITFATQAKAK